MIVNITEPFWDIVKNVHIFDHDTLSQTSSYAIIKDCMENNMMFCLDVEDNCIIHFENVSELFYKTLSYYSQLHPNTEKHLLLQSSIQRIEKYIIIEEVDDLSSELMNFSM